MKISFGTILDFVALTILVLICVSMVSVQLKTQMARNFHAQAVDEIENCNFSDSIIQGLVAEADNMGYKLNVRKYQVNDTTMAEVALDYTYSIPLLDIVNTPQIIRGTAR